MSSGRSTGVEPKAGVRRVIPEGGGACPASDKIYSGLWCWQAGGVGGRRAGGQEGGRAALGRDTSLTPPDFFMRYCLKF